MPRGGRGGGGFSQGGVVVLVGEEEAVRGVEDVFPITYVFTKARSKAPHAEA